MALCSLVKAFLKSGILTEPGGREETLTGTPQGGVRHTLNAMGNFCFDVTLSYRRLERPRRSR